MILSDVLNRILFKCMTTDDMSNRAANPIFSNTNILYELNAQMKAYAQITKGIRDVFSIGVTSNDQFINAPTLALRSEAYNYAWLISRGFIQPLDIRGQRDTTPNFRVTPLRSIGSWIMIYNEGKVQRMYLYPMAGVSYNSTTLSSGINDTVTTIPVVSTAAFISTGGRITIGSEKILYQYKDATNFYGCVRGLESTTASAHLTGVSVNENNLIMNYSRLPTPLTVTNSPTAPQLAAELEIVEDHIEGICDIVAYSLLVKIAPDRAQEYKQIGVALFDQFKLDIAKGYNKMRSGVNVREPMMNESGIPMFGSNML